MPSFFPPFPSRLSHGVKVNSENAGDHPSPFLPPPSCSTTETSGRRLSPKTIRMYINPPSSVLPPLPSPFPPPSPKQTERERTSVSFPSLFFLFSFLDTIHCKNNRRNGCQKQIAFFSPFLLLCERSERSKKASFFELHFASFFFPFSLLTKRMLLKPTAISVFVRGEAFFSPLFFFLFSLPIHPERCWGVAQEVDVNPCMCSAFLSSLFFFFFLPPPSLHDRSKYGGVGMQASALGHLSPLLFFPFFSPLSWRSSLRYGMKKKLLSSPIGSSTGFSPFSPPLFFFSPSFFPSFLPAIPRRCKD